VEGIKIWIFKKVMKSKMIKIQPLCDEYPFLIPYLSFEEEDCDDSYV
jgi:hypothetical protein